MVLIDWILGDFLCWWFWCVCEICWVGVFCGVGIIYLLVRLGELITCGCSGFGAGCGVCWGWVLVSCGFVG